MKEIRTNLKKSYSLYLILLLLCFLIVALIFMILKESFIINGSFNINVFLKNISNNKNFNTIINSLKLGIAVVVISTIIALPLALILGKTKFGKYKILDLIFMIPMMTPPYISSMGWILFMQKNGVFSKLFPSLKGITDGFFSFFGLALIMSFHVFPFMLSILKNSIENQSDSLLEANNIYGGNKIKGLLKITLPLLRGNYVVAALMVFLKTLSEYGTPATFGSRIHFEVFTTEIHRFASVAPIDFNNAASLSLLLLSICMIFWYMQNVLFKKYNYKLVSGKASKKGSRKASKILNIGAIILICLIITTSIGIPYIAIIITSLLKLRGKGINFSNMTLKHYGAIFTSEKASLAISNSLILAVLTGVIVSIISLAVVMSIYNTSRKNKKSKLKDIVEAISIFPSMVPSVIMVIGIMLFYNKIYKYIPIYNTNIMLLFAYVILYIPFGVQNIKTSLGEISNSLVEASYINGASFIYTFRKVLFPLILNGILAGFTLTFITSFRELVASSLLQAPGKLTISTFILREFESGDVSVGMAMSVICVAINLILLFILNLVIIPRREKQNTMC